MRYVRFSLMRPLAGREAEVKELNERLIAFYQGQQGCLQGYLLTAADDSGELGRFSLWESAEAADRAANDQHSLSLRSRLRLLVRKGHTERSFYTE